MLWRTWKNECWSLTNCLQLSFFWVLLGTTPQYRSCPEYLLFTSPRLCIMCTRITKSILGQDRDVSDHLQSSGHFHYLCKWARSSGSVTVKAHYFGHFGVTRYGQLMLVHAYRKALREHRNVRRSMKESERDRTCVTLKIVKYLPTVFSASDQALPHPREIWYCRELRLYLSEPIEAGKRADRISNGKMQTRIRTLLTEAGTRLFVPYEYINLSPPLDDRRQNHLYLFCSSHIWPERLTCIRIPSLFTSTLSPPTHLHFPQCLSKADSLLSPKQLP